MLAIENAVESLLSGSVIILSVYGGFHFTNTLIGLSDLIRFHPFSMIVPPDLPQRLEDLLVNTTLSLSFFLQQPPTSQIV